MSSQVTRLGQLSLLPEKFDAAHWLCIINGINKTLSGFDMNTSSCTAHTWGRILAIAYARYLRSYASLVFLCIWYANHRTKANIWYSCLVRTYALALPILRVSVRKQAGARMPFCVRKILAYARRQEYGPW